MEVDAKNVVTFKPGKEMEERVRQMKSIRYIDSPETIRRDDDDDDDLAPQGNGAVRKVEQPVS